jgi:hypothetical protein
MPYLVCDGEVEKQVLMRSHSLSVSFVAKYLVKKPVAIIKTSFAASEK